MYIKVKRCPRCGEVPVLKEVNVCREYSKKYVQCESCGYRTKECSEKICAYDSWNKQVEREKERMKHEKQDEE